MINHDDDPTTFVGNALSPARALSVTVVDLAARAARVIVPDYQLSLAIGKEGQNVRLAARLTNWRIDIQPDTQADAEGGRNDRPGGAGGGLGGAGRAGRAGGAGGAGRPAGGAGGPTRGTAGAAGGGGAPRSAKVPGAADAPAL